MLWVRTSLIGYQVLYFHIAAELVNRKSVLDLGKRPKRKAASAPVLLALALLDIITYSLYKFSQGIAY